jgi:GrpB-like predicted nucleotidyltransferase (UPF0157 family)
LTAIGYIDRGDQGSAGGYLLVKESEPEVRTVHLHIVEDNDAKWFEYLRFRDALRSDAVLREQYANLKLRLARQYPADREAYTDAKDAFIHKVLAS